MPPHPHPKPSEPRLSVHRAASPGVRLAGRPVHSPPPLSKSCGDWTWECRPTTKPCVSPTHCLTTYSWRNPLSRPASLIFIKTVKFWLSQQYSGDLRHKQCEPRMFSHGRHRRYHSLDNSAQPALDHRVHVWPPNSLAHGEYVIPPKDPTRGRSSGQAWHSHTTVYRTGVMIMWRTGFY